MRHAALQIVFLLTFTGVSEVAIGAQNTGVQEKVATKDRPVVYVNGEPVRRHSIDLMLKRQQRLGVPADARNAQRVEDELVAQTILAQQALKAKLDHDPEVAGQIDLNRLSVLSSAYLKHYFDMNPVTDETLATDYERRRDAGQILEYRVRHISVPTEEQAREILAKIRAGEKMEDLAKKHSTDPGADRNGGDIGWFRPDTFVDESFAEAVAALDRGEITPHPVPSRWGWQIIRVEEGPRVVKNLPDFSQVHQDLKDIMRQRMMKQRLDELVDSLKADSMIIGEYRAEPRAEEGSAQIAGAGEKAVDSVEKRR